MYSSLNFPLSVQQHAFHLCIYFPHFVSDLNLLAVLKIKSVFWVFYTPSILLTWATYLFFPPQRVNLSFDFPFYGHLLREITVATGGKLEYALSLGVISVTVGPVRVRAILERTLRRFITVGVLGE